jgi:Protein of unknown function (DUF2934)
MGAGTDEKQRDAVDRRAADLWAAAGSPDGHELVYRLRAEQEIANASVAGEEDPLSGDEADGGAAGSKEDALRRAVEDAVPENERLPSGADENPISERIRDGADGPPPRADRSTVQGGTDVVT